MKKSKNLKETILYTIIGLSAAFTVGILLWIIGFIFYNGIGFINWTFLTSPLDSASAYVNVESSVGTDNKLGLIFEEGTQEIMGGNPKAVLRIADIEGTSKADDGMDRLGQIFPLAKNDIVNRVEGKNIEGLTIEEANAVIDSMPDGVISVRITREGGGIYPMLITTLMMIGLSLLIAVPIGVMAAIYLVEYAKPGRLVSTIRFATESLAGIPSIIYGLFGMIFFVMLLNFHYSLLAGALTLSIILLPVIVRQTEESLKSVPQSYREASFGLGANKLYTIRKAVLPSAIPGILVAVILSIGRIIGESAALLLTAGTAAKIPRALKDSGATLTVKAYTLAKEDANIAMACAIGTVIIFIIIVLNALSKLISKKMSKI